MRTLLLAGPGGAGRTTIAAATALSASLAGTRTLVLSADRGDGLGAALGVPTGDKPVAVNELLTAWRPDASAGFREDLVRLQEKATTALDLLGAARLETEEMTTLPGAEELNLLRALRDAALSERFDLIVVDLPPASKALALLALPEELRRYLRRLLPAERQAARALRPVLGRLAGVPMPAEWLYETAGRWDVELAAVEAVLAAPDTAVRIVAEPGPAGDDAVRDVRLGLALRRLPVETLIANRVVPDEEGWLAGLAAQQRKALAEWDAETVAHLGRDPRGLDDLHTLAVPPVAPPAPSVEWPVTEQDGVFTWTLPLPGAVRGELDLIRRGDELVVTVGPFKRIVALPSVLRRCTVEGASLRDGELRVRFAPDPQLWPRER
ncbi:ArsA family ATPase [Streptomyces roseirectus]|uniref:ArsA family ATPase n=1 Tax=Streptomyces roseirectus TaxID=2768066 RepID=A0A7H0IK59_9ACTN|nr:ArsA-related P-loop ATPase [Streptomyces roseirectus]QNP73175.1 ArsA family ATPase [Streptomyces roseirectus]